MGKRSNDDPEQAFLRVLTPCIALGSAAEFEDPLHKFSQPRVHNWYRKVYLSPMNRPAR